MTLWEALPPEYLVNKHFGLSNILPKDMPAENRKYLRSHVREFTLAAQICGKKIPSVINDVYNCQIVQYIDIAVKNIGDAPKTAQICQKFIRPLSVIRLCDNAYEMYSFALKRLNQVDSSGIIVESLVTTANFLKELPDGAKNRFLDVLAFGSIKNRNDKRAFYMEMLVKAYLLTNQSLSAGQDSFLASSVWYNGDKVNALYDKLCALKSAKDRVNSLSLPSEKAAVNGEIKRMIDEIKSFV